ncbi:MAG: serine protein kinase RIO [Candidatus Heimdallarchaeota archaeon]|nr:serine protein kinase RIO [Candidatus Heimdallarchaeota archaeon]
MPDKEDFDTDEILKRKYDRSVERLDRKSDRDRIRDKEDDGLKLVDTVFDNKTRLILFSMITKGFFDEISGAISTGKEANVYYAPIKDTGIVVKIFRIDAPSFRNMRPYMEGDHRFRSVKSSRAGFIEAWAKKEFKNLKRLEEHGIPAPKPIYSERNIVLMEFLGADDAVFPRLKDTKPVNPGNLYERLIRTVKDIYRKAMLVHADLSEFNILYHEKEDQFYIIDVGQGVLWDHPRAQEFLLRDLNNLNRYFGNLGVNIIELPKVYKWVTGDPVNDALLYSLEFDS